MKKTILTAAVFLITLALGFGQESSRPQTEFLFSHDKGISFSGFGGPLVEFSNVDGAFGVFIGGGGAAIINQTFFFGGYGMGLTTDQPRYSITLMGENGFPKPLNDLCPQIGHGGFWLGYIHQSHKIIHLALSTKIGWGALPTPRGITETGLKNLERMEFSFLHLRPK